VTSNQKRALNKLFLEFCSRRGLIDAKMPNEYIYIRPPPSGSPFGEALVPQGDLRSKKGIQQIVLRILFVEGSILCKNTKLAYLYLTPFQAAHLGRP